MKRRSFLAGSVAAVAMTSHGSRAQKPEKVYRVVMIAPVGRFDAAETADPWRRLATYFLEGMREAGYIDGKNMRFEGYSAEGKTERIAEIAKRVLQDPVDVFVATGGGANEVAATLKRLTSTVPIVLANSSDPVEQGLVASLGRPGGNITGFVGNPGPEFEAKRLQLLGDMEPKATRIAYLGQKTDWESPAGAGVRAAAVKLGLSLLHAENSMSDFAAAFASIERDRPRGLFVARNPWNYSNRRAITELAAQLQIVAVYPTREFTEIGGLMSYGPSLSDLYRRVAGHVHIILRGGNPAEIPIEQPTKFELVINAKTAKSHGLAIPASLLTLAEDVIE